MRLLVVFLLIAQFGLVACQKKAATSSAGLPPLAKGLATVYFDYDRSAIREDQMGNMNSNASILKEGSSMHVTVEGHCDERGTNEYNLALGDRRSSTAKNYLINLGVDPARMATVSYGEERPACASSDESCWAQNRRGEFRKN